MAVRTHSLESDYSIQILPKHILENSWHHGELDRLSAESALRSAPVDSWLVRRSREQEFNVVSKKVALETEASSSSSEQWRRASSVSCSSRRRHRRRSSRTDGGGGGGGSGRGSRSFDGASRAPVTQVMKRSYTLFYVHELGNYFSGNRTVTPWTPPRGARRLRRSLRALLLPPSGSSTSR